jgi:FdhD protein
MSEMYKKIKALRVDDRIHEIDEIIVEDKEIELRINDLAFGRFSISPNYIEEFAVGYLVGEGLIESKENITDINIEDNVVDLQIDLEDFELRRELIMSSDCFGGVRQKIELVDKIESNFKISKEDVINASRKLKEQSQVWKQTGGTHIAALVNQDVFIAIEDVSRHVAIDKVMGAAFLKDVDFSNSFMVSSGRMPSDMVLKVAQVGIPILTSKAAPTVSGLMAGEKSGITLVGFVRGGRFNIYTNSHRIII